MKLHAPELDQLTYRIVRHGGRLHHLWSDGTLLPVVRGGDDPDPQPDPAPDPQPDPAPDPTAPPGSPRNPHPAPDPPAPDPDKGFPENTPVADMTIEQQAAYWRHQSRKHEDRAKARGDYDDLKRKADELDELKRQQMTDQEKAVDEARKAAKAETLAEVGSQLVDAKIEALCTGRLEPDQVTTLLEGLDRTRFLTDDGKVDTDKVKTFVDGITPPATGDGKKRFPDLGQGRREGKPKASVAAGREMFESSRTSKAS